MPQFYADERGPQGLWKVKTNHYQQLGPVSGELGQFACLRLYILVLRASQYAEQQLCGSEDSLKFRGWLLVILFTHVVLHPWVHAIGVGQPATSQVLVSHASAPAATAGDDCELCRVGHSAAAARQLPRTHLLNPRWIQVALQAVNYESLLADLRLPSRAPPAL